MIYFDFFREIKDLLETQDQEVWEGIRYEVLPMYYLKSMNK